MKVELAQVVSCCVYGKPQKWYSTCMATFHTCLTVGPIQLFISFYKRAPLSVLWKHSCTILYLLINVCALLQPKWGQNKSTIFNFIIQTKNKFGYYFYSFYLRNKVKVTCKEIFFSSFSLFLSNTYWPWSISSMFRHSEA